MLLAESHKLDQWPLDGSKIKESEIEGKCHTILEGKSIDSDPKRKSLKESS
jgi:hypothetical protein